jgi:hypothetical protein
LGAAAESYNVCCVLSLPGDCSPDALTEALNEVVRRHDALRMRILEVDGRPWQVVERTLRVRVEVVDLSGHGAVDGATELDKRIEVLATQTLSLADAPLFRATFFRLPEEGRLCLVMHHLVCDGWSMKVLARELATAYEASLRNLPCPLPLPAVQFPDWVLWRQTPNPVWEAQLDYWRHRLAGLRGLELPTRRPRRQVARNQGRSLVFSVDPGTTRSLHDLHRAQGCTLFTTLLAGFAAVLARRSGATDIPIGTDMANRIPSETEALIGMFINQVVLRVDLRGDPDFGELLARLRHLTAEAYAHQSVPFEDVVDAVRPRADPSVPPLIQAKLVLENTDTGVRGTTVAPEGMDPLPAETRRAVPAQLDLTLYVLDLGSRLRCLLVYDVDLFDDDDADALALEFTDALSQMVADLATPVARQPAEMP